MSHHKVTNKNDIPKFDDLYFNVWKHQLSFIMKAKTFYDYCGWLKKQTCSIHCNNYPTITFYWKGELC